MSTPIDRPILPEIEHMGEMARAYAAIPSAGRAAALNWFLGWARAFEAAEMCARMDAQKAASQPENMFETWMKESGDH